MSSFFLSLLHSNWSGWELHQKQNKSSLGQVKIIIMSSPAVDSTSRLDVTVKFEKDVCEAADNVSSIILLSCSSFILEFLGVPCTIAQC